MGTAWAGGINLHAAALMPGIMAMTGGATLPPGLDILTKHAVLPAAGFMYGGSDSCPTSHEEKGHPPTGGWPFWPGPHKAGGQLSFP